MVYRRILIYCMFFCLGTMQILFAPVGKQSVELVKKAMDEKDRGFNVTELSHRLEKQALHKLGVQEKEGFIARPWDRTISKAFNQELWLQSAFGLNYQQIVNLRTGPVRALTLSEDGKRLAFIADSRTIRFIDQRADGSWADSSEVTFENSINSIVLCNDGRRLVVGLSHALVICDQHPDGRWIVAMSMDATRPIESVGSNKTGTRLKIAYAQGIQSVDQDSRGNWQGGPMIPLKARAIRVSGDGKRVVVIPAAVGNKALLIFEDPQGSGWDGRPLDFPAVYASPNSIALSHSGMRMAVGFSGMSGIVVTDQFPSIEFSWPLSKAQSFGQGTRASWEVALSGDAMRLAVGYNEVFILELAVDPTLQKRVPRVTRDMILKTIENLNIEQYQFIRDVYIVYAFGTLGYQGSIVLTPAQLKIFKTFSVPVRLLLKHRYNLTIPEAINAVRRKIQESQEGRGKEGAR